MKKDLKRSKHLTSDVNEALLSALLNEASLAILARVLANLQTVWKQVEAILGTRYTGVPPARLVFSRMTE